ncbi:MAG: hypothetical protein PHN82_04155 [bacterium]|nr:hypothetical protein [bacterium]
MIATRAHAFLLAAVLTATAAAPAGAAEAADTLCFVQFHHPGDEHEPDTPTGRTWNRGDHRRKFLLQRAVSLAAPGAAPTEGEVVFWAEWEPPSLLLGRFEKPAGDEPRFLFRPVQGEFRKADPPYQNTDPFVFGGPFLYGNCKQHTRKGRPTDLRSLKEGSVILFGSNRGGSRFVLDTVFVVDGWTPYTNADYAGTLKGKVPPEYFDITLHPIAHDAATGAEPPRSYRLYTGATPERPYRGMFSYFPCRPFREGDPRGFARPVIRLPGIVDDELRGWQRMNPQEDIESVVKLWHEVTRQVLKQGLSLGVRAEMPGKP